MIEEESEFLICNNELIDLIAENSVKLTEAQMREAEGEYQTKWLARKKKVANLCKT